MSDSIAPSQTFLRNSPGRVNLAYVTSVREVGGDERIGREIQDPVNGTEYGYREGNLENLARRLARPADGLSREFADAFNLVAVFTDDSDEQWAEQWGQAELWPRGLRVPIRDNQGNVIAMPTLDELTIRIPSTPWRQISNRREPERKAAAKAEFERAAIAALHERGTSLLISDSYTSVFGPTFLTAYPNHILNVHPAITQVGDPDRLPGLFPTRDAFTRARFGYIIVDDKVAVDIPEGERIAVVYEGRERTAVRVPRSYLTGVTVHVVTERVDNGPVVLCSRHSIAPPAPASGCEAYATDGKLTPEFIRNRNYALKREVLPRALLHYAAGMAAEVDDSLTTATGESVIS